MRRNSPGGEAKGWLTRARAHIPAVAAGATLAALSGGTALAAAPTCISNAAYLVVEAPHKDSVGNSYIVRDRTAAPKSACSIKPAAGDVVIGGADDPYFLLRLAGRYLLIDAGSGPDRTLIIRDLKAGTTAFEGGYSDEDITITAAKATFWATSEAKPTKKTCKDLASILKNGLTPVIETQTTFDLVTGKLQTSKSSRCSTRQ